MISNLNDKTPDDKTLTLKGQQAIDLWLKGKDEWNSWVEEHKYANVDFSKVPILLSLGAL